MRQKKYRFGVVAERSNVIERDTDPYKNIKGRWSEWFGNDHPIVLELACGRGEYSVGLARLFPDKNFIGIDIKGDRIFMGSTTAMAEGLEHVAFVRTQIQNIDEIFDEDEVSEIWIVFPDPRPKNRDRVRRLTYPRFLDLYQKILKPGGIVRVKTDNTDFFDFTLEVLRERKHVRDLEYTYDLYDNPLQEECHGIKTHYEIKFGSQGHKIKFLRFKV